MRYFITPISFRNTHQLFYINTYINLRRSLSTELYDETLYIDSRYTLNIKIKKPGE
jgi:hypothetical protein